MTRHTNLTTHSLLSRKSENDQIPRLSIGPTGDFIITTRNDV